MNIVNAVKNGVNMVGAAGIKYSPEILIGVGIASMVGATIVACKNTPRAIEVIEEAKKGLDKIEEAKTEAKEANIEYADKDVKIDTLRVVIKTVVGIAKNYGLAAALMISGIIEILKGRKIYVGRIGTLYLGCKTAQASYNRLYENIKERYGEDVAKELKYGIKAEEIEEARVKKDGTVSTKTVKKKVLSDPDGLGKYTFIWNEETCPKYFDEAANDQSPNNPHRNDLNLKFLLDSEEYFNRIFPKRKFIFLNEALSYVGLDMVDYGQNDGWVWDPEHPDKKISFGIFETLIKSEIPIPNTSNGDNKVLVNDQFLKGAETGLLLDFNCDGPITDKFVPLSKENRWYQDAIGTLKL